MSSVSIPPVSRSNAFASLGFFIPGNNALRKMSCCYTSNHTSFIYHPHTGYGKVGTTAAGYLASRKRL